MIFALLKNKRLRLQIIVLWLVLGTGLLSDETSALKCYSCDGLDCKTSFKTAATKIDCATGYCEKITDGDTVKMQCSPEGKEGECIKKEFPDCYTFSEENKGKLTGCTGAADAGTGGKEGVKICSCDSELCNKGGDDAGAVAGAGAGREEYDGPPIRKGPSLGKCYKCLGEDECSKKKEDLKQVDCPFNVCYFRLEYEPQMLTDRDCYDHRYVDDNDGAIIEAECNKEALGNVCARLIAKDHEKVDACIKRKRQNGKERTSAGGERRGGPESRFECLCKGKLCNFDQASASTAPSFGSSNTLVYLIALLVTTGTSVGLMRS